LGNICHYTANGIGPTKFQNCKILELLIIFVCVCISLPDISVSQKCIPYFVVMLPASNGIINGFGFLITTHSKHASNCNAPVRAEKYAPYRITDMTKMFARSQHGKAALKKETL
jgi:hypothetical protein